MRRSQVLESASTSLPGFSQLGGPSDKQRAAMEADARRKADAEREARWQADLAAKVNQAFERGLAQGRKHAAAELDPLIAGLRRAHAELAAVFEAEAERHALALALNLAQTVIQTQVKFDPAVLEAALREAVGRTSADAIVRIRVNPDDLAAAQGLCAPLGLGHVEMIADASLARGGCIVDTRLGEIHSTIEHRWQAARELLEQTARADLRTGGEAPPPELKGQQ